MLPLPAGVSSRRPLGVTAREDRMPDDFLSCFHIRSLSDPPVRVATRVKNSRRLHSSDPSPGLEDPMGLATAIARPLRTDV
jgi:hypothetical protein